MSNPGVFDIGHIADIQGDVPGLKLAASIAARTPEWQVLARQRQAGKDFNDQPVAHLAGSDQGQPLYSPPDL